MYHARDLVVRTKQASEEWSQELSALTNAFKPEWLEYWFDGLGFCVFSLLLISNRSSNELTLYRHMERFGAATNRSEDIRCSRQVK